MNSDEKYYKKCRELIEKRVDWGNVDKWTHKHFRKLSELVYKDTGTLLSHNTLKRFWGRVSYKGGASISTKNALSQFLGYKNWNDFLSQIFNVVVDDDEIIIDDKKSGKRNYKVIYLIIFTGLVISGFTFLFINKFSNKKKNIPDNLLFKCINCKDFAPHHFELVYNLKGLKAKKIVIQPDFLRPQRISSDSGRFTYVYLLPGFAKAH